MAWYPPSTFEGSDETLLNSNQTRQFFGDVSAMWINRRERERDEAERLNPGSGFPVARRIANRKYWQLDRLAWTSSVPVSMTPSTVFCHAAVMRCAKRVDLDRTHLFRTVQCS